MSCCDYQTPCCEDCGFTPERGKECPRSKDGFHCWHYPQTAYTNGYTLTTSTVAYSSTTDQQCCFCGVKESELHGPYHPLNAIKWTPTVPATQWGGTIHVTYNTGSTVIATPTSPYVYPTTTGFITTNPMPGTLTWDSNSCIGGLNITGNGGCTNSPGSASAASCPIGCTGGLRCKRGFNQGQTPL